MSKLIRLNDVLGNRGRSRSAHYLDIQQGVFTKPVKVGKRAVAWPAEEVAALISAQIAGATDEEIRQLVVDLEAARLENKGGC